MRQKNANANRICVWCMYMEWCVESIDTSSSNRGMNQWRWHNKSIVIKQFPKYFGAIFFHRIQTNIACLENAYGHDGKKCKKYLSKVVHHHAHKCRDLPFMLNIYECLTIIDFHLKNEQKKERNEEGREPINCPSRYEYRMEAIKITDHDPLWCFVHCLVCYSSSYYHHYHWL